MPDNPVYRPTDFPNQLGYLQLSAKDIVSQIVNYHLTFPQVRDKRVEWGIHFPPFINAFYNYVHQKRRIPTQEEYFQFYLKVNSDFFSDGRFDQTIYRGLQARLYRTYPSLVRDIHFNKLLESSNRGYEIVYNLDLDLAYDIDAMLIKDGQYWAACLYTQTRRGNFARAKKVYRHTRFLNVNYVEFPVELEDNRKVGEFFLYGEPEITELFSHIEK